MAERSIAYRFVGNFNNLVGGLAAAGRQVDEFGNRLGKLDRDGRKARQALDTVGRASGRMAVVVGGGLALAAKAAMDWETAWTGVLKTVDGSDAEIAQLEKDLRGLTAILPASHTEIAGVAEAAGQLGVKTADVAEFTKTMVMLGETTNLTAEGAATAIAQMANVMQTAPGDVDNLGASLVALGNAGASTEAQILEMAQRIAGAGAMIGLAESDVLAIANAAASVGVEVEAGGSAISRVFTELAKATAQGSDAVAGFSDVAGMSADEFTRAFRDDPARAFDAFVKGLRRIKDSGGDVFTTLEDLGLSGIRVQDNLLRLAGAGDLLTKSLDLGAEAFEENSALAEEFAKRAGTTASQVQLAFNQITNAGIDVGNALLPIIAGTAKSVGDLATAFSDLPGPVKTFLGAAAGIVALFGGGLWFTSKVVGGVASMNAAMADLGMSSRISARGLASVAAKATAAVTAIMLLDDVFDRINNTDIDPSGLNRSLDAFADGRMTAEVEKLGDAFKTLRSGPSTNVVENAADLLGIADSSFTEAKRNIQLIDDQLASLVEAGDTDKAATLFEKFSEMAKDAGLSTKETAAEFDQYLLALENAEPAAGEATEAAKAHAEAVQEQAAALGEAREAAAQTASGFLGLGDSLDDASVSLGGWLAELEAQAAALRDFTKNAKTAARDGLDEGLIASLAEAGPEGARRMAQLADATDTEIARANRAWRRGQQAMAGWVNFQVPPKDIAVRGATRAQKQIGALLAAMKSLPPNVQSKIRAEGVPQTEGDVDRLIKKYPSLEKHRKALISLIDKASGPAARLGAALDAAARDRQATITLNRVENTYRNVIAGTHDYFGNKRADGGTITASGRPFRAAMGTTVPDDGMPYGDRYPYLLAPGEEVISNRYGQADKHRALLKAINAGRLADGGTARAANYARSFGGQPMGRSGSGEVVHRVEVVVRGEMDLARAKAQIRQIAHSAASSSGRSAAATNDAVERMNWS